MISNTKKTDSGSDPSINQVSGDEDEEAGSIPHEIKNKDCYYWITRGYLLFNQLRKSCESESKKKQRASYESVFGSDFGQYVLLSHEVE